MGAFLTHTTETIMSLWQQRTLRMTARATTQICLGLTAPFILAAHMFDTRSPGAEFCNLLRLSSFRPTPASAYTLDFAYTHATPKP